MGKVNRKYLIGGAVLIVIAFLLWAVVYYVDYSVNDDLNKAVNELENEWSDENKEAYDQAYKQYKDARSYIANVAILIVIFGLIGFILIAVSILKGEKKSKYDASKESIDEKYAKGEITKKQYEKMKKDMGNK